MLNYLIRRSDCTVGIHLLYIRIKDDSKIVPKRAQLKDVFLR